MPVLCSMQLRTLREIRTARMLPPANCPDLFEIGGLRFRRSLDQFFDRPYVVAQPACHRWRLPEDGRPRSATALSARGHQVLLAHALLGSGNRWGFWSPAPFVWCKVRFSSLVAVSLFIASYKFCDLRFPGRDFLANFHLDLTRLRFCGLWQCDRQDTILVPSIDFVGLKGTLGLRAKCSTQV
jgi:hypothetical protein